MFMSILLSLGLYLVFTILPLVVLARWLSKKLRVIREDIMHIERKL